MIVNTAAVAYRGAIPDDCWHEPYMTADDLEADIAAGVQLWAYESGSALLGVMGIQPVHDVFLIRHAYVRPQAQRQGVGAQLLARLRTLVSTPILIGTWADASWAIRFYQKHGFELVDPRTTAKLLRTYWNVPDRQAQTAVVLTDSPAALPTS
ncbi:MAG TPA: GNAT family N-acetyltransferase [Gemmatimonadaceae bacterium]|nr:GNAT family N-acetyltransferase [Gemmatimonadaceae bacterium]